MISDIFKLFDLYSRFRISLFKRWNKLYFKLMGIKYGKNLNVYNKIYIKGPGKIVIGNDFRFSSDDGQNPICRNIRGAIYTMTGNANIVIGDRVGISSSCLWAKDGIIIGDDVKIGGDCLIIDTDAHPHDYIHRRDLFIKEVGWEAYFATIPSATIEIGDDVWIGARCQILKGVHIGARSIIAAGSIVTKDIPSDVIAGGNPCRVIKRIVE